MKPCACSAQASSSVRISPVVASSYDKPAMQAAAALHYLIAQFRLKKKQDLKKAGRA